MPDTECLPLKGPDAKQPVMLLDIKEPVKSVLTEAAWQSSSDMPIESSTHIRLVVGRNGRLVQLWRDHNSSSGEDSAPSLAWIGLQMLLRVCCQCWRLCSKLTTL